MLTVLIPIVILFMKDQPQLEAWIGTADTNFVAFAQLDGFGEARMIVAVEHAQT